MKLLTDKEIKIELIKYNLGKDIEADDAVIEKVRRIVAIVREAQLASCEAELKEERERIVEEIEEIWQRELLLIEHGDYSNGVESFGIDEGRIRALEYIKSLVTDIQFLKEKILGGLL